MKSTNNAVLVICSLLMGGSLSDFVAADVGIGVSVSELNTPVEPSRPELDLSTISETLQFSYNAEDWLLSVSTSSADNHKAYLQNNRVEHAVFDQLSKEIYASYFYNDWTISAAIGTSSLEHKTRSVISVPNQRLEVAQRIDEQNEAYESDFLELSLGHWFDLDHVISNLSLSFDAAITRYDSSIDQDSSIYLEQIIDSELLDTYLEDNGISLGLQQENQISLQPQDDIVSISSTVNYGVNFFELDWYTSAWITKEWSDAQSGAISFSRNRNGRVVNRTLSSLDEWSDESSTASYTIFGASAEVSITENFSASVSLYQEESASALWQLGAFYYF